MTRGQKLITIQKLSRLTIQMKHITKAGLEAENSKAADHDKIRSHWNVMCGGNFLKDRSLKVPVFRGPGIDLP